MLSVRCSESFSLGWKPFKDIVAAGKNLPPFYEGGDEDREADINWLRSFAETRLQNCVDFQSSQWPKMELSLDERIEHWLPWRKAVIVKALGRNLSYSFLNSKLNDLCKPLFPFELTDFTMGYYLVRFRSKEDYDRVLHEGPWMILGSYLTIRKWCPDFDPEAGVLASTLLWARFPNLPVEYFRESTLMKCANLIGRAVKVDKQSAKASRGKYARVCVEVNLNEPLIWVCEKLQAVQYEGRKSTGVNSVVEEIDMNVGSKNTETAGNPIAGTRLGKLSNDQVENLG